MSRVRFVAAARSEFLTQIRYYADTEPGLGRRFAGAVDEAIVRILAFPHAGSPSARNARHVLVRGFPFSVHYQAVGDGILIFAVAHHARRSDYWTSRMDDEA